MIQDQTNQDKPNKSEISLMKDMETTAARMREIIVGMPPHDLLGYIYAQRMKKVMSEQSVTKEESEVQGLNRSGFVGDHQLN
jgi:hypothetical protein